MTASFDRGPATRLPILIHPSHRRRLPDPKASARRPALQPPHQSPGPANPANVLSASMLASFPASILNQIPAESGIPFDSIKKQRALADICR